MESGQETLIYIEENDKAEAGIQSKGFAKAEVKNRAYINTLGVELGLKYLASEGINVSNLHNLHSVHKFLEEFDIADIILPNVHIDVRVVFSDKFIFVPKSHFEYGLTPDIYLVFQLAEDHSHVKVLGFFEPKLINKNNQNRDYYFIEKEKLTPIINLKSYIEKCANNTSQILDKNVISALEANFVSMVDNDLHENDKKNLISNLLKSDELRDKFIEYSNFEILSYRAANNEDFKDLLSEQPEVSVQESAPSIAAVSAETITEEAPIEESSPEETPVQETPALSEEMSAVEEMQEIPAVDEALVADAPVIEDIVESNIDETIIENINPDIDINEDLPKAEPAEAADEFDLFDKNTDEFETQNEPQSQPLIEEDLSSHDMSSENLTADDMAVLDEIAATEAPVNDIEIQSQQAEIPQDETSIEELFPDMVENIAASEDSYTEDSAASQSLDDFLNETTPKDDADSDIEYIENVAPAEINIDENPEEAMRGYTTPKETEPQELINFDDIDISVTEGIENYRKDDYSSNDAVAFDVLEPMSLNVDLSNSGDDEGQFITSLSADEAVMNNEKIRQQDIKTDIIDKQITGIGAIDTISANHDEDLAVDIDALPSIDNLESFDNINTDELLQPIDSSDMLDKTISEPAEEMSMPEELSADAIEELSSNENVTDAFNTSSLEDITSSNAQENLPEKTEPESLPEIDNLSLTPESFEELNDNTGLLDTESLGNIEPLEALDSLEDTNIDTALDNDSKITSEASANTSDIDLLFPKTEQNNISAEKSEKSAPADSPQEELLSFASDELPVQEPQETAQQEELMTLPSFEEDKKAEESILPEVTDIFHEAGSGEELLPAENNSVPQQNTNKEGATAADSAELISFAEDTPAETPANDDMPFTLLDDNAAAPKPVNLENANLSLDSARPTLKDELSAAMSDDLSATPAELDSKNILAEIDTLLGTESENTYANVNTQNENNQNTLRFQDPPEQDLSPEETIYMQTMAKEKGKKGVTFLLVIVAAMMGVFAVTTFLKNNKTADNSAFTTPREDEIIDNFNNETGAESVPKALPVAKETVKAAVKPPVEVKEPPAPSVKKEAAAPAVEAAVKGHFYPEVKKITFEIPDYLSYSEGMRKYLQTVGRSVKLSASSDLLLTSDYSVTDRVKIVLKMTPSGNIKNSEVDISSGSQQIDDIVLQSVKNTLDVVKPPAGEVKGDEFNLAVIINF